jgi:hypothetical protein
VPKAVPVVEYVDPLLRLTTGPHSPALEWTFLHRRIQQPSVQSESMPSQRPGWAAGKFSLGCIQAQRVHVLCCASNMTADARRMSLNAHASRHGG